MKTIKSLFEADFSKNTGQRPCWKLCNSNKELFDATQQSWSMWLQLQGESLLASLIL